MESFKASNGYQVKSSERDNRIDIDLTRNGGHYGQTLVLTIEQHAALREFFQAERDEALGRWRFSDDLVVYPVENHQPFHPGRSVFVFDEAACRFHERHEGQVSAWRETRPELTEAATAYFSAHPEPKPWHDAKPGEVWVLTVKDFGGRTDAFRVSDEVEGMWPEPHPVLKPVPEDYPITYLGLKATTITAGRRIWPESE